MGANLVVVVAIVSYLWFILRYFRVGVLFESGYVMLFLIYTVSQKKLCQCYFVNNSVKNWPNLIIFGTQHREET